ncbi:MAG TPA: class A beta-lactamase [Phenylobacterium sp.]|uniref:class A beta-lactamase n=1 Tax=Phenylobacterium sp. TaxID=1871053 RepID=UPI002D6480AE|nr:class A beta-lactamase [Phenylobacterium sp.]HZZ68079.1 class A beta-lactamase [Phenylobacterium sp.]
MVRLQSFGATSASPGRKTATRLGRRELLIAGASLALAACGRSQPLTASRTPRLDMKRLANEVGALAQRALPGVLGFGLMNLESGEFWDRLGDRHFPMMSVFKLPLGAYALSEADAGRLSLAETITITGEDLSPPLSPIADAWPGRTTYTVGELFTAAVSNSDNTAADVLMRRVGGPGAVSGWLQAKGVDEVRVDRYERELSPNALGMASFRAAWKGAAAFDAAVATVPPAQRHAATLAYMADPKDSATPRGMLGLLRKLDEGSLISAASTRKLLLTLQGTPRGVDRIRAGLPKGASFAHKPGTSATDQGLTAAFNDVGIFTLPDRRSYAIAAFLTGSTSPERDRAALFADLGRTAVRSVG